FLDQSDVILGIGCSFAETPFGVKMPAGKRVIHATLDSRDFNRGVECKIALAGDARLTLAALIEALRGRVGPRDAAPVAREIAEVEAAWMKEWLPLLECEDSPLSPYRVLWELQRTVDV